MEELNDLCSSDDLSLTALCEKVSQLSTSDVSQEVYNDHPFLHTLCSMNKYVTLEMVRYILDSFPGMVTWEMVASDNNNISATSYALHCACYNEYCPDSVIDLLLKDYPPALEHLSKLNNGVLGWNVKGLPLHYYLARTSNIDIKIVNYISINFNLFNRIQSR